MDLFTLIEQTFLDQNIDELLINSHQSLITVCKNMPTVHRSPFQDQISLIRSLQKFAQSQNIRLDPNSPSAGGEYMNSLFRWHAILPPLSNQGGIFSIRRHRFSQISLDDFEFLNEQMKVKLQEICRNKRHVIISGVTGSGKTTLLSCLLKSYYSNKRVIILETLNELPLISNQWLKFIEKKANVEKKGEVSLKTMMQECLRLRPDHIVLGEIRGVEISVLVDAMTTGHEGVLATIHGNSKAEVLNRIKLLLLKDKLPLNYVEQVLYEMHNVYLVEMQRGEKAVVRDVSLLGLTDR